MPSSPIIGHEAHLSPADLHGLDARLEHPLLRLEIIGALLLSFVHATILEHLAIYGFLPLDL